MAARRQHPLDRLQRDLDTLFDTLWGGLLAPSDRDLAPVRLWDFDIKENDQEIVVRAEMPGFEDNEIDVQINNDTLTIKAEKEQKGDRQEEYLSFYRTVTLPPGTDAERAQATYRNGVLEVHIPRAEGAQMRRLRVQGQQAASTPQGQQASSAQAGSAGQAGSQGRQATANQVGASSSRSGK